MKEYLIKLLGGYTKREVNSEISLLKDECESFYEEYCHLYGNNHSWRGTLEGVDTDGNLVVVHSHTSVRNCRCSTLIIAPWVSNFSSYGVISKGE